MSFTIAIDARKLRDFGIGTYVRSLVQHLAVLDRRNRYLLLVGPAGRERLPKLPDNFETVVQRAPVYSLREQLSLSWTLTRRKVDLYHATHYVLPAFLPCRVVVTIHDIIHLLYPEFLPNRVAYYYAERMMRRAVNKSDRIITVSKSTQDDLVRWFGIDEATVEVVHNGIEDEFLEEYSDEDLDSWMKKLGLERPYLLFVGNPKPHKNLDRLLKAYAQARQMADFSHPLVLVGDRGTSNAAIQLRAEHLGITDQVRHLGHLAQEALPAVYQGAAAFLYPTLYEGFGLPVVEAMASGTPVITSNTSALKEVAAGYADLVNPLDADAIARAIAHVVSDGDHRASLKKLGLRRSQDFRWDRAAHQTLATYHQALEGAEPKSGGTSEVAEETDARSISEDTP